LDDWAKQLKGYWDHLRRQTIPIHIVATGSSALRVTTGSRAGESGWALRAVNPQSLVSFFACERFSDSPR
jgi:hypothetical protein